MAESNNESTFLSTSERFFDRFYDLVSAKFSTLPLTILGDFKYVPLNKYSHDKKKKVAKYLQVKYLNTLDEIQN